MLTGRLPIGNIGSERVSRDNRVSSDEGRVTSVGRTVISKQSSVIGRVSGVRFQFTECRVSRDERVSPRHPTLGPMRISAG